MKNKLTLVALAMGLCVFMLFANASGKPALKKGLDKFELEQQTLSKSSNPCVYKGRYLTVDLRKIAAQFKGKNVTYGKYTYILSLCSPLTCSFSEDKEAPQDIVTGAAACQYISNQKRFVKLGSTVDAQFHFVNLTYFYMTFTGGNTEHSASNTWSRQTQIDFLPSADCSQKVSVEFEGEKTSESAINYVFTVNMRMDEPSLFAFEESSGF